MAVAFVSQQNGKASAASLTVSVTVGAGSDRLFLADVHMRGLTTVSDITLNGSSISSTQIGSGILGGTVSNNGRKVHIYYAIAPSTGTYDCVLTPNASAQMVLGCSHWTGVHQTTPNNTEASDTDTAAANLSAAPASATDQIVFVAFTCGPQVTGDVAPDGSQAQIYEDVQTGTFGSSSYITGSAGTTNVGYTISGTPSAGIGQALLAFGIKPAAAAASAPPRRAFPRPILMH